MAAHTERELGVWLAWLDMQWDRPSRTDQYLMQVACEVRRVLAKRPNEIKLADFRLRLVEPEVKPQMTREQATALSKARWLGMMTRPVKVVQG